MLGDVCRSKLPIPLKYIRPWKPTWSRTSQVLDEDHILDLEDEALQCMSAELELQ